MTLTPAKKTLKHYLNLKYPMEVVEDDGAWVASVPDLPGCNSFGDTVSEAIDNVERTKDLWIESQYKANLEIPEPTEEDEFSGKFVLRIPKLLHRSLAYQAQKQGVSLNHYASHLLSQGHSLTAIKSLLEIRQGIVQDPWVRHGHTPQYKFVSLGGELPGNISFVMHLRKPATRFKEEIKLTRALREKYLPR